MMPSHGSVIRELSEWGVAGGNSPEWCVILRFMISVTEQLPKAIVSFIQQF